MNFHPKVEWGYYLLFWMFYPPPVLLFYEFSNWKIFFSENDEIFTKQEYRKENNKSKIEIYFVFFLLFFIWIVFRYRWMMFSVETCFLISFRFFLLLPTQILNIYWMLHAKYFLLSKKRNGRMNFWMQKLSIAINFFSMLSQSIFFQWMFVKVQ